MTEIEMIKQIWENQKPFLKSGRVLIHCVVFFGFYLQCTAYIEILILEKKKWKFTM